MSSPITIQSFDVSISSVWMLPPEYSSFRQALESKGYTLRDISNVSGPVITLATRGSIEIFTNVERRVVGVRSDTSTSDLLAAHEDLSQIYKELGVEASNLLFYEFIGAYIVSSSKSPMKTMGLLKIEKNTLAKIGSILEKDLAILGLNLTIKNGDPTSSEWLRLVVEPLYVSANKKYNFRTICRGKKEDVVGFVKTVEKRAIKIIEELEGSA